MSDLKLEDITDFFIRKKLGLKKTEEHKYDNSYNFLSYEDRPYHKRFDMTGGACKITQEDGFKNNEKICNIFKHYFKQISFGVYFYKGMGYYYIYPKYVKKKFEGFDDKIKDYFDDFFNGSDVPYCYYHKKCISGMGTTEIIKDILINCYIIEKTIKIVINKNICDIKYIINDNLTKLTL